MSGIEALEDYLKTASILYAYEPKLVGGGGHAGKFAIVLEGGVSALCKPSSGIGDGGKATKNEVGAWVVARILRWTDLVAATVLRRLRNPTTGTMEEMAVQVLWPGTDVDPDPSKFTEDELWRAALFDLAILHADRGGSNSVGVPPAAVPFIGGFSEHRQQLKLVDHGYAFNHGGPTAAVNSVFVNRYRGQQVPEHLLPDLRRLANEAGQSDLVNLLDPTCLDALVARVDKVVQDRVL